MQIKSRLIFSASALLLSVSAHATCLHIPKAGMPAIFKGTTCQATSTNVIAATVPSITPQNTVVQITMPPNVPPPALASLPDIGKPPGPAVGLLYAIQGDNLSQENPTSPPPAAPQPVCTCGGYPGTVSWSGWDSVGWKITPGGCYACPPAPSAGLPPGFCTPSCTLSVSGAYCNATSCYVGNGQVATIGANGWTPTLTTTTVSQSTASTAAAAAATVAATTGASSCTTAQVTAGQCNTSGALSAAQLAGLAAGLNSGNAAAAAAAVTGTGTGTQTGTGIGGAAVGIGG